MDTESQEAVEGRDGAVTLASITAQPRVIRALVFPPKTVIGLQGVG
jgi:hypothetical protein